MFNYTKHRYLIIGMTLIAALFTSTIANAAYHPNYNSEQEARIYNRVSMLINLDKTPDEIARTSETAVIHSIEQSVINKK